MVPVWDFVIGIFARKALLNMGWILSIFSCQYLISQFIDKKNKKIYKMLNCILESIGIYCKKNFYVSMYFGYKKESIMKNIDFENF